MNSVEIFIALLFIAILVTLIIGLGTFSDMEWCGFVVGFVVALLISSLAGYAIFHDTTVGYDAFHNATYGDFETQYTVCCI